MTYTESASASVRTLRRRGTLLAVLLVSACAGHSTISPVTDGDPAGEGGHQTAVIASVPQPVSVPQATEPTTDQSRVSGARAFLDEAKILLDDAEYGLEYTDPSMAEYQLKEALQILLDADQLLPTRTRLEMEKPVSEQDVILHEALLRLRDEFEHLWTRANAVYDRLIPRLNLNQAAAEDWSGDERLDLEEMNEALEVATEPAPGSWQGIRDLLLEMEAEGQIDLDMELASYSDYAWTRVYWSLQYYTGRGRRNFRIWLERSGRYRELVEQVLVEEGLPRDMVFLCMIESGFSPRAYSRVAATGPWQFMYYTAQKYGLKTYRNHSVLDERRDFEKSTRAAAAYLTDLYAEFQSWPLAMAAYNSGEGRVRSAQRWARNRNRAQDYWTIYNRLPSETRNYVPYYLAALAISKNPERFDMGDVLYQQPFEESYETVHVSGALALKQVADMVGASESVITELNPELYNRYSPSEGYDLRLPTGTTDAFVAALEQLPLEGRKSYLQHVIRWGETGSVIAERYGVAWSEIRSENGIRDDRSLQVGQTLQIPKREKSRYLTEAEIQSLTRSRTVVATGTPIRIRVRSGDTISGLATRYGVTWVQIRQWNNLRNNMIYAGQSLTIYPRRNAVAVRAAVASATLPATGVYTIGRNDTLWDISQRFNVSVANLKQWNGLRSNTIYPGQKLIVTRAAAIAAGTGGGGGPGGS